MLANTTRQCLLQTGTDYAFRHLQPWFKADIPTMVHKDPFKTILAAQRIGNVRPTNVTRLLFAQSLGSARTICGSGRDRIPRSHPAAPRA